MVPATSISAMTLTASFLEGEGLGIVETEEAEELILVGVDAERVPALAGERRELVDLPASRSVRAAVTAAWICEARSAVYEAEVREAMEEETEEAEEVDVDVEAGTGRPKDWRRTGSISGVRPELLLFAAIRVNKDMICALGAVAFVFSCQSHPDCIATGSSCLRKAMSLARCKGKKNILSNVWAGYPSPARFSTSIVIERDVA
jgi:hypothetical protein